MTPDNECTVEACQRQHHARGYCVSHYSWALDRDFEETPTHELGSFYDRNNDYARHHDLGKLSDKTAPSKSPTRDDIVWAAGIFEGEGTCRDQTGNGSPQASVSQNDSGWLTNRLESLFGGTSTKYNKTWKWTVCGSRARGFLLTIYTLLSPQKQEQVKSALEGMYN